MGEDVGLQELQRLIFAEIFRAMKRPPDGRVSRLLAPAFRRAVRRFAEVAATCDRLIAERNLVEAAQWTLGQFTEGTHVRGAEHVLRNGPLVIACNHPGTVDALAVISSAARQDLKIVAWPMPFLQCLPHVSRHLIFAANGKSRRATAARQGIQHLAGGGALLLFARGRLEPDPATMRGAGDEFRHWSRSIGLFLRSVPQTTVVPAIVSGVLAPRFVHHPLTWIGRGRLQRQRMAVVLQFIHQMRGKRVSLVPRVTFGEPLPGSALQGDPLPAIIESVRSLLARHTGLPSRTRPGGVVAGGERGGRDV